MLLSTKFLHMAGYTKNIKLPLSWMLVLLFIVYCTLTCNILNVTLCLSMNWFRHLHGHFQSDREQCYFSWNLTCYVSKTQTTTDMFILRYWWRWEILWTDDIWLWDYSSQLLSGSYHNNNIKKLLQYVYRLLYFLLSFVSNTLPANSFSKTDKSWSRRVGQMSFLNYQWPTFVWNLGYD